MIYFELTLLEDVDAGSIDASDPPEILARSASAIDGFIEMRGASIPLCDGIGEALALAVCALASPVGRFLL